MLDDILYVEADRNYCKINTESESFLIVSPLNKLCEKINQRHFIRIHRSFVVNFSKLDAVADSFVEINSKQIPVSKQYKDELHKMLNKI